MERCQQANRQGLKVRHKERKERGLHSSPLLGLLGRRVSRVAGETDSESSGKRSVLGVLQCM